MIPYAIENEIVRSFRENREVPSDLALSDANLFRVSLHIILSIGRMLRQSRQRTDQMEKRIKDDGTIVTDLDSSVEDYAHRQFRRAFTHINFLGEETGGCLSDTEPSVALDPIDGTRSFIAQDSTNAVSLSIFKNSRVILGFVMNPATGEIGYSLKDSPTRLIQLSCFGEEDSARELPSVKNDPHAGRIRVNLQPGRGHRKYEKLLKDAWHERRINYVKSAGGSPALALLEAARGYYVYVHPWESKPATPFDLSAGIHLVENAGGRVIRADNRPVEAVGHRGLFIAGTDPSHLSKVLDILRPAAVVYHPRTDTALSDSCNADQ